MKNAVIDVGSNSVRLLIDGEKFIYNTQLSEGLLKTGYLQKDAVERTLEGIIECVNLAKSRLADGIKVFATEAVRSAKNGKEFVDLCRKQGIEIDVIDSVKEAQIGFLGAYTDGTVAVLDIGGASSELVVGNEKEILYSYSLDVGCVKMRDMSGDEIELKEYATNKVKEYGTVPSFDKLIVIGGTVTTLCAVAKELAVYDRKLVHNSVLKYEKIKETVDMIFATDIEKRKDIKGLHIKRITVAPAGGILLLAIMDYLKVNKITVSENDNLEGYVKLNKL